MEIRSCKTYKEEERVGSLTVAYVEYGNSRHVTWYHVTPGD